MKNNLNNLPIQGLKNAIKPPSEWKKLNKAEIMLFAKNNQHSCDWRINTQKFAISFAFACLLIFIPIGYISATNALPGNKLYPIKRLIEDGQVYLAGDNVKRTQLKEKFLKVRLVELEQSVISDNETASDLALSETEKSVVEIIDLAYESENEQLLIRVKDKLKYIEQIASKPAIKEKVRLIYNLIDSTDIEKNQTAPSVTPTEVVEPPTVPQNQPADIKQEQQFFNEELSSVEGISTQTVP